MTKMAGRPAAFLLTGVALLALLLGRAVATDEAERWVRVEWVADGDTIVLEDGRHIRYIGIDAPETAHDGRPAEPMAAEAREKNRRLVEGRPLRLAHGPERTDRYGRHLAYVYRQDGLLVNAELLRLGFAHYLHQAPNTDQSRLLVDAQREGMQAGRGIWRFVDRHARPARPFLGNRRSKRFHDPDCPMARRMAAKHRVRLPNRWAGFWEGYSPARECVAFPSDE